MKPEDVPDAWLEIGRAAAEDAPAGQWLRYVVAAVIPLVPAPAPAWRTIDIAPRDGTKIDLWFGGDWNERMPGFAWFDRMGFWHNASTHQSFNDDPKIITHWQPLPEPPEEPK